MIDPITRRLHDRSPPHGPVMLVYHSVRPGGGAPAWPWSVSRNRFRGQLDFLREAGYATPTVSELLANPGGFLGRTAVITFDDGYVDNLAAWEELKAHGMKATWYITSGSLGRQHSWPADGRPQERLLSADELRAMAASGMEIGSHTVTHPRLPATDDETLARELADSKATLEDCLGHEVPSFAYPFGDWDERCEMAVKQTGYRSACLTRTGWALREQDPYRLRRLTVFNTDSGSRFARKLGWASHDVGWHDIGRYAAGRLFARSQS